MGETQREEKTEYTGDVTYVPPLDAMQIVRQVGEMYVKNADEWHATVKNSPSLYKTVADLKEAQILRLKTEQNKRIQTLRRLLASMREERWINLVERKTIPDVSLADLEREAKRQYPRMFK